MGAEVFETSGDKPDIQEAFDVAQQDAFYWHGHGGYTGTIAEKQGAVIIEDKPMTFEDAKKLAWDLIDKYDERIDDKWGPAGAIRVIDKDANFDGWYFFGWASS